MDEGLQPLEGGLEGETWTKGLGGLRQAATEFVKAGAVFGESPSSPHCSMGAEFHTPNPHAAKWRATIKIQPDGPSDLSVYRNSDDLAQYAKICQVAAL